MRQSSGGDGDSEHLIIPGSRDRERGEFVPGGALRPRERGVTTRVAVRCPRQRLCFGEPYRRGCMAIVQPSDHPAALLRLLRELELVAPAELDRLAQTNHPGTARDLAAHLIACGLLTPYQVNRLFQGRGGELVLG